MIFERAETEDAATNRGASNRGGIQFRCAANWSD